MFSPYLLAIIANFVDIGFPAEAFRAFLLLIFQMYTVKPLTINSVHAYIIVAMIMNKCHRGVKGIIFKFSKSAIYHVPIDHAPSQL